MAFLQSLSARPGGRATPRRVSSPFRTLSLLLGMALCCALGCERSDSSSKDSLPELSSVPPFALVDQDGHPFGTAQLSGKAYLAAFMFTRCPSICPRVTARMKEVDAAVRRADLQLELVSFSVDPEYDTPLALRNYAVKHGAQGPHFHFVTGDFKQIAMTAENGFKIGLAGKAEPGKPHLGITHGSHLVLVNQRGSIVGYFPSSEPESVSQIVAALRALSS